MSERRLYVTRTGAVATIVLNRPEKRNALNLEMWIGLSGLLQQLETDEETNEAFRIGLVDHLYPCDEIADKTYAFARLLTKRSQVSIRGAKQILQAILDGRTEEDERIAAYILQSYESADDREGIQAFLEKRKPYFR